MKVVKEPYLWRSGLHVLDSFQAEAVTDLNEVESILIYLTNRQVLIRKNGKLDVAGNKSYMKITKRVRLSH
jgi:hypothetical protein